MKNLLLTTTEGPPETRIFIDSFASKMVDWKIETLPSGSLKRTTSTPDVTLVEVKRGTQPSRMEAIIPRLADIQAKNPWRSYVIFSFVEAAKNLTATHPARDHFGGLMDYINRHLSAFPDPERVSFIVASRAADIPMHLDHFSAKLDLTPRLLEAHPLPQSTPRPSPLDQIKEILKATEDLRASNGKLSATAIATAFGIKPSELASWLGRSRQTLNKTPDADSLQEQLGFFERVARLRAVLSQKDFLKWLRMPTSQLDDESPLG